MKKRYEFEVRVRIVVTAATPEDALIEALKQAGRAGTSPEVIIPPGGVKPVAR
jgi:hypothetical protein